MSSNGLKLHEFGVKKEKGRNWFINGVVIEWNNNHVVRVNMTERFKRKLDIFRTDDMYRRTR